MSPQQTKNIALCEWLKVTPAVDLAHHDNFWKLWEAIGHKATACSIEGGDGPGGRYSIARVVKGDLVIVERRISEESALFAAAVALMERTR